MSNHINLLFQKYVTKGVELSDDHFQSKLRHAIDHMVNFKKNTSLDKGSATVLEIGTGWYPIIPLVAFLCGYNKIISFDINAWLKKPGIITAISMTLDNLDLLSDIESEIDEDRLVTLRTILNQESNLDINTILASIKLEPKVEDFTKSEIKPGSIDYICSNNTYEHIYVEVLEKILEKFKQVLKPTGTMSHFIDMSDHFAHFDKSITVYNFLKYSKKFWATIDNSIQPQNRLRLSQYRQLYQDVGLPISEEIIWPNDLQELEKVDVHPEYAGFSKSDLAICHAYLITDGI